MRLVLDTGILVSALLTKGTPPDMLYQAWRNGLLELVTSEAQITEFLRVIQYPKLKSYIKPLEAKQISDGLHFQAVLARDLPDVTFSPDRDDDKIIATAIAGKANYIVSGDKRDMLAVVEANGIPIITARAALDLL